MVEVVRALSHLEINSIAEERRLRIVAAAPAHTPIVDGAALSRALGSSAPPTDAKEGTLVQHEQPDGSGLVFVRGSNDTYSVRLLAPDEPRRV